MKNTNPIPHLRPKGSATQLIVNGEPFLIIGGELHNSSSSSLDYMQPIWERLRALHLNTVLAAVTWELTEPEEGVFDFSLVDGMLAAARDHGLKLILLWFGTWKNGMSNYAPAWVKTDFKRFPRVKIENGRPIEILSTFSTETLAADCRAFAALMAHLKMVDGEDHTVIMVQVENEVGVLGDSRDRSEAANHAFDADVPTELIDRLLANKALLGLGLLDRWGASQFKTKGNWEALFGPGAETDELFMAWHYACYIDQVTAAGKAVYPLPMFVNAWLSTLGDKPGAWATGGQKPGEWPSGGPLPQTLDLWMAAAPHVDFFAPDIYQPEFETWCQRYRRRGNPLFIPEMDWREIGARQVFYALGEHDALGVSPFGIDSQDPTETNPFHHSYRVIQQMAPLILAHQGEDRMIGFMLSQEQPVITRRLNGYQLEISLDEGFGQQARAGSGLLIASGPDQFLGAGFGFQVRFRGLADGPAHIGILAADEGVVDKGKFVPVRRMNGDEAGRGYCWRFYDFEPHDGRLFTNDVATHIGRCTVYHYK
ncbi:MAG: DUF5597 domain-containing protein [Chloroflexota bacterium]